MAALQIANPLRLPPLHAEQIGRALHVDIQKGAAHKEIGGFRRDILGQLGQPLRGHDPRQPALAAPAHQIGHGGQGQAARILANLAGHGGREHLRLVHHHQGRKPVIARGIEQAGEELRGAADLLFDL